MGTGFPRLHRQLASAAAVLAIWLALAPHAHADLLPATPVAPVAASTASLAAASVTAVTNVVATPPAAELAKAAPVVGQVAKASPALHPVVSPAVQRLSDAVAPVVAVVRSVSAPLAAIAPDDQARPSVSCRRTGRSTGRRPVRRESSQRRSWAPAPPSARRRLRTAWDRRLRCSAAFRARRLTLGHHGAPWSSRPGVGPIGSAAASGGGAAASSPAALRPVSWLLGPTVLVRFAAPNQVPRSTTLLLQLERPG